MRSTNYGSGARDPPRAPAVKARDVEEEAPDHVGTDEAPADASSGFADDVRQVAWLAGALVLLRLVGICIASVIYLSTFLRLEAKACLRFIVLANVAVVGVLYLLDDLLGLRSPANLLDL